jgi:hypothetical protein
VKESLAEVGLFSFSRTSRRLPRQSFEPDLRHKRENLGGRAAGLLLCVESDAFGWVRH